MDPRIHVITRAVDNLERALDFYRQGLGLDSPGVVATELHDEASAADGAIAAFKLHGGLILSLYPRSDLAKDAGVPLAPSKSGEFSIGHIVSERATVDALLGQAAAWRDHPGQGAGSPLGHLLGLFRRSRRTSMGGDPQPEPKPRGVLTQCEARLPHKRGRNRHHPRYRSTFWVL